MCGLRGKTPKKEILKEGKIYSTSVSPDILDPNRLKLVDLNFITGQRKKKLPNSSAMF